MNRQLSTIDPKDLETDGKWHYLLPRITGQPDVLWDGKQHPCPVCGGNTRFNARKGFDVNGHSGCHSCHSSGVKHAAGDGYAIIMFILGCGFNEAVNMVANELGYTQAASPQIPKVQPRPNSKGYQTPEHAAGPYVKDGDERYDYTKMWGYQDATGETVAYQVRYENANGKTFRTLAKIDGQWHKAGSAGLKLRPLRFDRIKDHATIYVCEGEKVADAVAEQTGLPATCSIGGKGGTARCDWSDVNAERFVVLCDNDDEDHSFAKGTAKELAALGIDGEVVGVSLPDLQGTDDAVEWLEKHDAKTPDELVGLLELIVAEHGERIAIVAEEPGQDLDDELEFTDMGNAELLQELHGENVRYVKSWGRWLVWGGQHWELDSKDNIELMRRAQDVARFRLSQAPPNGRSPDLVRAIKHCASVRGLSSMTKLLRGQPGIPIQHDALDQDPLAFNVQNGTILLATGEIVAHDKRRLMTKISPAVHRPDATCPKWDQFLLDIFASDAELIAYFQRLCGYFMTGKTSDHILPIFYGEGANGKTTAVNIITSILGPDYSTKAPQSLLTGTGHEHPTQVAMLFGKRLAFAEETEQGARLRESQIKDLTGGGRMVGRGMNQDFWDFDATHKMLLCTNHKPEVIGRDEGMWRRLKLVPFTVKIPEADRIKDLDKIILTDEMPGVLNWLVRGAVEWQRFGLEDPTAVKAATDEYRSDSDEVASFIHDNCTVMDGVQVGSQELFTSYSKAGGKLTQTSFGKRLRQLGYEKTRRGVHKRTVYLGLKLADG